MNRTALSLALLLAPAVAAAGPMRCPTAADRSELSAFGARLASADSPDDARRMALAKTRVAHKAVTKARKLLGENDELVAADARIDALEAGIAAAGTQAEVADNFTRLGDTQAMSCDYSTVEIVVIVIGFVLGILPGIIFLLIFC